MTLPGVDGNCEKEGIMDVEEGGTPPSIFGHLPQQGEHLCVMRMITHHAENDNHSQSVRADTLADYSGPRPGADGLWGHGRVDAYSDGDDSAIGTRGDGIGDGIAEPDAHRDAILHANCNPDGRAIAHTRADAKLSGLEWQYSSDW
jgi:hypothetical protein